VRNAVRVLEENGHLVRLARRATVPAALLFKPKENRLKLRCINILFGPALMREQLHWLLEDYLIGYTKAMESYPIKTRHAICPDDLQDFELLMWSQAPLAEQGCILVNRHSAALLIWLHKQQIPFVVQRSFRYPTAGLPPHHGVFINKAGGGFLAAHHLIELGHRRIGFIGDFLPHLNDHSVYDGFLAALTAAGLEARTADHFLPVHTDILAEVISPIEKFLSRPDLPTALVTDNDTLALAVLDAARRRGLKIPDDLSVVGFNDQAEASQASPPLTTIQGATPGIGSDCHGDLAGDGGDPSARI